MSNMKAKTVPINSDVLRWVIGGSGWDIKELSDKTGISRNSIDRWVNENSAINTNDLQKISKEIKRPLSILLLPKPPIENNLPYYRKIRGIDPAKMISRDVLAVIRNARYIQSNARELLKMISENAQPHITLRTLRDDPEMVAEEERKVLGLDIRERLRGEEINQFVQMEYQLLREKIESSNILVMQAGMDVKDVRGFTLLDDNPKLILINSRDEVRPQFFTLLHEYAHLLLDTDGICLIDLNDDTNPNKERDEAIERWCNNFAGAVIMPRKLMLEELDDRVDSTPQQVVDSLSAKFCSSKTATVVRILNLIGDDSRKKDYLDHYKMISSKSVPKPRGGGGSGGRNMAKECINKNGRWYTGLVSNAMDLELITTSDMARYLNLKTKHFENLKGLI